MFLDANIFIHAYHNRQIEGKECGELLGRVRAGERAVTSPLVIAETTRFLEYHVGKDYAVRSSRNILGIPNLQILEIDKKTAELAINYFEQGLEPHDAFHAALMKQNGIQTICSYDKDFDKIKEFKRKEP